MSDKLTFSAQQRTITGKKVKQLRLKGELPANVTSNQVSSLAVSLNTSAFNKLYDKAGDTSLVYLSVAGESAPRPVLIDDVEIHPVTGDTLHVVFKQVNLNEKISAEIPVELVGEFKVANGVLLTVHDTIEVEALPTDLPEKFEINVELFTELGQAFTFAELVYDSSKITLLINEEEKDSPIVLVQEVKEEVEEEPVVAEGEAAPADGEAPAAGTDAAATDAAADKPKA